MSYGWLCRNPSSENVLEGFAIDREKFPTRYEEYKFALDALPEAGFLVDAGSGFNPEIHNFAYMAERKGWYVLATDANPAALDMPPSQHVVRWLEDLVVGVATRGLAADAWTCVSTLEHLQPAQQLLTLETAFATLRPGGVAILTVDLMAPERLAALLRYAGFEVGDLVAPNGALLVPRVACAVAVKPLREALCA